MKTTIKQQMAAVKQAMKEREHVLKSIQIGWLNEYKTNHKKDAQWQALNDTYSTLAAVALMPQPSIGIPYNKNDLALS